MLAPAAPQLEGARHIFVVPDGALQSLPMGVLVTAPTPTPGETGATLFAGYKSVPFLARQVAITQLPSVAALATLRALPAASGERQPFVGFGDPVFSARQPAGIAVADAAQRSQGEQTLVLQPHLATGGRINVRDVAHSQ